MQNQEINPALVRLYYLQQLGITAYAPRVALAGALAVEDEVACIAAVEESAAPAVRESAPVVAAMSAPAPVVARPRVTLDVDLQVEASKPVVKPAPAAERAAAKDTDPAVDAVAPFQLLFTVASPELALVLQIPALASPALRDAEARLLQNLLRWLGHKMPEHNQFLAWRWPLPGSSAAGAVAAGRSLHVFLQQAAAERPFSRVLMLGAMPAQCLQQHYQHNASEWQCWTSHSLAELLALPELKRDTWLQLQSLHAQLLPPA